MTPSFFRRLDEHAVDWLLVSGQATILYGAATFSEDVDLWVEPSAENLTRLLAALRDAGARYYKLTPPVTAELARRHHAFHFTVPLTDGGDMFLDVMGSPPRVGEFAQARSRARTFATPWGALPTADIVDIVELKKTQRPADYPIIGRLVLVRLHEFEPRPSDADLRWALQNMFSLPELRRLATDFPGVVGVLDGDDAVIARAVTRLAGGESMDAELEDEVSDRLDARTVPLRRADRHFWRAVIDELREMRSVGDLVPRGTPV